MVVTFVAIIAPLFMSASALASVELSQTRSTVVGPVVTVTSPMTNSVAKDGDPGVTSAALPFGS
jgi:hypothetical protein